MVQTKTVRTGDVRLPTVYRPADTAQPTQTVKKVEDYGRVFLGPLNQGATTQTAVTNVNPNYGSGGTVATNIGTKAPQEQVVSATNLGHNTSLVAPFQGTQPSYNLEVKTINPTSQQPTQTVPIQPVDPNAQLASDTQAMALRGVQDLVNQPNYTDQISKLLADNMQNYLQDPSLGYDYGLAKQQGIEDFNRQAAQGYEAARQSMAGVMDSGQAQQQLIRNMLMTDAERQDLNRQYDIDAQTKRVEDFVKALGEGRSTAEALSGIRSREFGDLSTVAGISQPELQREHESDMQDKGFAHDITTKLMDQSHDLNVLRSTQGHEKSMEWLRGQIQKEIDDNNYTNAYSLQLLELEYEDQWRAEELAIDKILADAQVAGINAEIVQQKWNMLRDEIEAERVAPGAEIEWLKLNLQGLNLSKETIDSIQAIPAEDSIMAGVQESIQTQMWSYLSQNWDKFGKGKPIADLFSDNGKTAEEIFNTEDFRSDFGEWSRGSLGMESDMDVNTVPDVIEKFKGMGELNDSDKKILEESKNIINYSPSEKSYEHKPKGAGNDRFAIRSLETAFDTGTPVKYGNNYYMVTKRHEDERAFALNHTYYTLTNMFDRSKTWEVKVTS